MLLLGLIIYIQSQESLTDKWNERGEEIDMHMSEGTASQAEGRASAKAQKQECAWCVSERPGCLEQSKSGSQQDNGQKGHWSPTVT